MTRRTKQSSPETNSSREVRHAEQTFLMAMKEPELELAFRWLADPLPSPPPPSLECLTQVEWFLLRQMLDDLLEAREHSSLH